jgi:formylglycine-generating enzyme required for sulfatase activity
MVEVPAGELEMGASDGEPDEQPVHRVKIAAFEIDATEVTTEAYAGCVGTGKCEAPSTFHANCNGTGPDVARHPVNCVTWKMADAFCRWRGARLPTEEEWEFAARGPQSQTYPWGNEASADKACWNRPAGKPCTCTVGSHASDTSPFGAIDMAGNVAEWTQSPYCRYDGTDCKAGMRVIKGGSCDMKSEFWLRSSYRDFVGETERGYNLGFRCARSKG